MSNEEKITQLLKEYGARPVSTTAKEREEREWWARLGSGILISEGHEETELDRQMDKLYINGQIARAEIDEIIFLKYL